jgi:hypothetical protein
MRLNDSDFHHFGNDLFRLGDVIKNIYSILREILFRKLRNNLRGHEDVTSHNALHRLFGERLVLEQMGKAAGFD